MNKLHYLFGIFCSSIQFITPNSPSQGINDNLVDLCCSFGKDHFIKPQCNNEPGLSLLLEHSTLLISNRDLDTCRSVGAICCGRERKLRECLKGRKRAIFTGSCQVASVRKRNVPRGYGKSRRYISNNIKYQMSGRKVKKRSNKDRALSVTEQECCHCCHLGTIQKQINANSCILPMHLADSASCVESFYLCCSKESKEVLTAIQVTLLSLISPTVPITSSHATNPSSSQPRSAVFTSSFTSEFVNSNGTSNNKENGKGSEGNGYHTTNKNHGTQSSGISGITKFITKGVLTDQESLSLPGSSHSSFLDPAHKATSTFPRNTSPTDCLKGYAFNKMSKECEDINECSVELHQCSKQHYCINTIGSHYCEPIDEDEYEDEDETNEKSETEEESRKSENKEELVIDLNENIENVETKKEEEGSGEEDKEKEKEVDNEGENSGESQEDKEDMIVVDDKYELDTSKSIDGDDTTRIVLIDLFYTKHTTALYPTTTANNILTTTQPVSITNNTSVNSTIHNIPKPHIDTLFQTKKPSKKSSRYKAKTNSPIPPTLRPSITRGRHGCSRGYLYNTSTKSCQDIDECLRKPTVCSSNMTCLNSPGAFRCLPKRLLCSQGHQSDPFNTRCVDTNECSHSHLNLCGHFSRSESRKYHCHNLQGTYKCLEANCPSGYALELDKEQRKRQKMNQWTEGREIEKYLCYPIECGSGYYFEPSVYDCVDINECEVWKDEVCQQGRVCTNSQGSYSCDFAIKCHLGFDNHHVTGECIDVDECQLRGKELCDKSNSDCVNSPGSYQCRCKTGFQHDPQKHHGCVDINECQQRWACQQQCYNTWGSHVCSCRPGFNLNHDNRTCADVDECGMKRRLCNGFCVNTDGSYYCYCPEGYTKSADGMSCQDINECEQKADVCGDLQNSICTNTVGGHKCMHVECPKKFRRIYSQHYTTEKSVSCQRSNSHCVMSDTECRNALISYSIHFITIHQTSIQIPYEIFTMRAPKAFNKLLFRLNVTSSVEPHTGRRHTISDRFFYLQQKTTKGTIQLIRDIKEPTDIDMILTMDSYDRHRIFQGTGAARIVLYVSKHPWEMNGNYMHPYHRVYSQQHSRNNQHEPLLNQQIPMLNQEFITNNHHRHRRHQMKINDNTGIQSNLLRSQNNDTQKHIIMKQAKYTNKHSNLKPHAHKQYHAQTHRYKSHRHYRRHRL